MRVRYEEREEKEKQIGEGVGEVVDVAERQPI